MSLQHLIRALFAQYEAGGFFAPSAVPTPFGIGVQQLGEGAVPDIHAFAATLNAWSQTLGGTFGSTTASTQAGANPTKTAAMELGGIYVHTGAVGATNVQMPTAADLYAAYPGATAGSTWHHTHVNLNNGTDTIVPGTGITPAGLMTVGSGQSRIFVGRITAAPTNIIQMQYKGSVVTATTATPHGLVMPTKAIIENMSNAAFNGMVTVASTPNAHTFTFVLPEAIAHATDHRVPNPTPFRPARLNTTPLITYTSVAMSAGGWVA